MKSSLVCRASADDCQSSRWNRRQCCVFIVERSLGFREKSLQNVSTTTTKTSIDSFSQQFDCRYWSGNGEATPIDGNTAATASNAGLMLFVPNMNRISNLNLKGVIGANDARAGCVKIFDVVRLRTLAFFRAHWHPLGSSLWNFNLTFWN